MQEASSFEVRQAVSRFAALGAFPVLLLLFRQCSPPFLYLKFELLELHQGKLDRWRRKHNRVVALSVVGTGVGSMYAVNARICNLRHVTTGRLFVFHSKVGSCEAQSLVLSGLWPSIPRDRIWP